jgi:enterochelin esterase family protein
MAGIPRGTLKSILAPTYNIVTGEQRRLYLYQPPGEGPFPLMVVWDGQDYLRRGRLPVMLDNLAAQQRIRPLAVLMIANHPKARVAEYACSEASLGFLQYTALPIARSELNLVDPANSPGVWGVMGASMGGLMALFTVLRMPRLFGRALCQSGGFCHGDFESVVFDLVAHFDEPRPRIWLDVGIYDYPRLLEANRQMLGRLQGNGFETGYQEYRGGHNFTSWRDDLSNGLEYLFGDNDGRQGSG